MRDDFHLFGNPDDGEAPLDADLALVTAYLARELSPMQVLAVEERLMNDAGFRASMQPLIDAWAAPAASLGAAATAVLSDQERAESWRRFQGGNFTGESVAPKYIRRLSMKRVAAVIGVTVLPALTFAQAVVYSAGHENAPGHAIAERIIAMLGPINAPGGGTVFLPRNATVADEPVAGQLTKLAPAPVQRIAEPVVPPVPTTTTPAKPDRARVIALAKEHHAAIVRGDTAVNFIVMVLDASGNYRWSTFGDGSVLFEVAGDSRTAAQRDRDQSDNRRELMGTSGAGARGGGGLTGQRARAGGGRARGGGGDSAAFNAWTISRDSATLKKSTAVSGGAYWYFRGDSTSRDSAKLIARARNDSVKGFSINRIQVDSLKASRAAGARGRGGVMTDSAATASWTYRNGFVSTQYSTTLNQAPGLQEPGNGQSGVQGLLAKSVSSSETYLFGPGELAPTAMRVIVVNLIPGSNWRP